MNRIKPPFPTLIKPGYPQASGLIADYLVNRGQGIILHDTSPRTNWEARNHGIIDGATWVPGQDGWALDFDGIFHNVDLGTGLNPGAQATFDLSFKTSSSVGTPRIFGKETTSFNTPYLLYQTPAQKVEFFTSNSAPNEFVQVTSANTYNDGQWHNVVVTVSSTTATMYIATKGIIVETIAEPWIRGIKASSENVFIGKSALGGPFDGIIGNVGIYNRCLLFKEVLQKIINPYARYERQAPARFFFIPTPAGRISRYHNLSGLGGHGQMTTNPLG